MDLLERCSSSGQSNEEIRGSTWTMRTSSSCRESPRERSRVLPYVSTAEFDR